MPVRARRWPDPRVKPAVGAAELDWGHPLTKGLISALPLTEGAGDFSQDFVGANMVRSVNSIETATQYQWETTGRGWGPHISDSDGVRAIHLLRFSSPLSIPANASFSDFFLLDVLAFVSGNAGLWRTATGGDHFHIFQATTNRIWVRVAGSNVLLPGSGPPLTTGLHSECVVNVNSSSTTQYIDGELVQSATHFVDTTAATITRYGQHGVGQEMVEGRYLACYFWLRALSASEVRWLHAEPYAMLRPIVRRRYFAPAAAPVSPTLSPAAGAILVSGATPARVEGMLVTPPTA
jgi:Concanavalin A-like lectin/glucanases superfamily